MVLNEDMQLLLNENLCKQRDPHPRYEFDFDKKHIHEKVCGAQRRPLLMYNFYVSHRSQIDKLRLVVERMWPTYTNVYKQRKLNYEMYALEF